jgi:hypothetical protein
MMVERQYPVMDGYPSVGMAAAVYRGCKMLGRAGKPNRQGWIFFNAERWKSRLN